MNRADLQKLSVVRLTEARALLEAEHPSGAFYLAGYAVECALKSVIAKDTQQYDFPDKRRALDTHTHDLVQLMRVANLTILFGEEMGRNASLEGSWDTVRDWSERSRYLIYDRETARTMLLAVSDAENGVLPWITRYW